MHSFDFEENKKWQKALGLTDAVWRVSDISLKNESLKNKIKDIASDFLISYTSYISIESEVENFELEKKMLRQIDSLLALLSLAQNLSRLREINFIILKNEYKKIKLSLLSKIEMRKFSKKIIPEKTDDDVINKKKEETVEDANKERLSLDKFSNKKDRDKDVSIKRENEKKEKLEINKEINKEKIVTGFGKRDNTEKPKRVIERQEAIIDFFKKSPDQKIKLRDIKVVLKDVTDRTIRNDLKDLCSSGLIARSKGRGQGSYYYLVK